MFSVYHYHSWQLANIDSIFNVNFKTKLKTQKKNTQKTPPPQKQKQKTLNAG